MAQKPYRLAVFIGRFQPFHIGHRTVLEHATTYADSALVIIGSAFRPRSPKNPFSFEERAALITTGLDGVDLDVVFLPLIDTLYDDAAWGDNVRHAVTMHLTAIGQRPEDTEIILTGFEKDKSSAYVRWFPEWAWEPAPGHTYNGKTVSATHLRHVLYDQNDHPSDVLAAWFGAQQVQNLQHWAAENTDAVSLLTTEADYIRTTQARISAATDVYGYPFAVNTADAVIVQNGHVLLVERAQIPGKGQFALPGGHIDLGETSQDAVLREVVEECGLHLSIDTMIHRAVFDHPDRAERGWVRSDGFLFQLSDDIPHPTITAGDDAASAAWVPFTDIHPETMFEDHFDILQTMVPDFPFSYADRLSTYLRHDP
jgi:bifunctional NMN adenylyltransferase/nudix hydrolase